MGTLLPSQKRESRATLEMRATTREIATPDIAVAPSGASIGVFDRTMSLPSLMQAVDVSSAWMEHLNLGFRYATSSPTLAASISGLSQLLSMPLLGQSETDLLKQAMAEKLALAHQLDSALRTAPTDAKRRDLQFQHDKVMTDWEEEAARLSSTVTADEFGAHCPAGFKPTSFYAEKVKRHDEYKALQDKMTEGSEEAIELARLVLEYTHLLEREAKARAAVSASGAEFFGAPPRIVTEADKKRWSTEENLQELARILQSENWSPDGGTNDAERTAVAYVALNRMKRNQLDKASDIPQVNRDQPPSPECLEFIKQLMKCEIADNSGGATHFFHPATQRKQGRTPPDWSSTFPEVKPPGVDPNRLRLFRAPGDGLVR